MNFRSRGARRGFTLIELLVVVAIIALLISILLPSLRDAREQAKVAKCMANYRTMTVSSVQYMLDHQDAFPFLAVDGNVNLIASWFYGGKTPDDYWEPNSMRHVLVENKPLNPYLLGAKVEPDFIQTDGKRVYTEIPTVRCASDSAAKGSYQRMNWSAGGADQQPHPISVYDDCGTSYQYNLHAIMDLTFQGVEDPWGPPNTWQKRGQELTKTVMAKYSSSFVMFLEDKMDWGLAWNRQLLGFHGRMMRNVVGFLDGHAEYKQCDTRGFCGVGWSAINPLWAQRDDGNYPVPDTYYGSNPNTGIPKNCNPPYGG